MCNDQYIQPAMNWCKKIQCRDALTKGQLYDALINVSSGAVPAVLGALLAALMPASLCAHPPGSLHRSAARSPAAAWRGQGREVLGRLHFRCSAEGGGRLSRHGRGRKGVAECLPQGALRPAEVLGRHVACLSQAHHHVSAAAGAGCARVASGSAGRRRGRWQAPGVRCPPDLCWPSVPAGNYNLDGPIYVDLQKRASTDGKPVWQIKDVYYGAAAGAGGRAASADGRQAAAGTRCLQCTQQSLLPCPRPLPLPQASSSCTTTRSQIASWRWCLDPAGWYPGRGTLCRRVCAADCCSFLLAVPLNLLWHTIVVALLYTYIHVLATGPRVCASCKQPRDRRSPASLACHTRVDLASRVARPRIPSFRLLPRVIGETVSIRKSL